MEQRFETPKGGRHEMRTPTNAWAGFGLSKTSPFAVEAATAGMLPWSGQRENVQFDKASTTGLIDAIPTTERIPLSHFKDIHSLLHHLKLEHYISELFLDFLSHTCCVTVLLIDEFLFIYFIDNFVLKGVDMKIFATLTTDDLMELNITAFGARKRLILAINQLKTEIQPNDDWIQLSEYEDMPSLLKHLKMDRYIGEESFQPLIYTN